MTGLCADGFGEAGDAARGIPGGATLDVELELPSWKDVEDVSGDGGVIKKTLVSTKEWKVRITNTTSAQPALKTLLIVSHKLCPVLSAHACRA